MLFNPIPCRRRGPSSPYLRETTNYATFRQSNLCSALYCSSYGYLSCSSWFGALHLSCLPATTHNQNNRLAPFQLRGQDPQQHRMLARNSSTKCLCAIIARRSSTRDLLCFLHFAPWCRAYTLVVERLASCCTSCYYVIETYEL